eukprot:TRINITY_DN3191_c1_g1_i2.p1 TRINITY_DN3191_c1_g1~~TRINITY_DN3191_c1_g1_i2.p1  ORF type:complete len:1326 (+),score=428.91 TRINITY_DN3191_c1_g1_i2:425-3979(+)
MLQLTRAGQEPPLPLLEHLGDALADSRAREPPPAADDQTISNIVYGLRLVRGSPLEVRNLLSEVTALMGTPMGAQATAMALFGLFRSDATPEADALLGALARTAALRPEDCTPQVTCMALYGLQRVGACPAAGEMLRLIAPSVRLHKITTPPTALQVARSVFGLRSVADRKVALEMLDALVPLIKSCSGTFTKLDFAMVLKGLGAVSAGIPGSRHRRTYRRALRALCRLAARRGRRGGARREAPPLSSAPPRSSGQQAGTGEEQDAPERSTPKQARRLERLPKGRERPDEGVEAVFEGSPTPVRPVLGGEGGDGGAVLLVARRLHEASASGAALGAAELAQLAQGLAEAPREHATPAALVDLLAELGQRQDASAALEPLLRGAERLAAKCTLPLSAQRVGAALFGLRQLPPSPALDDLLLALAPLVARCPAAPSPSDLAAALYGLQRHEGAPGAFAVLAALGELAGQRGVGGDAAPVQGRDVGMALYGMRSMGPSEVVESMLGVVAGMAARCSEMDARSAASALSGLAGRPASPATEALLRALVDPVAASPTALNSHGVCLAFSGFQSIEPSPGSRAVLAALRRAVRFGGEGGKFLGRHVASALNGLRGHTATPEGRAMLHALAYAIRTTDGLTPQHLGNALYGLHNAGPGKEAEALLDALEPLAAKAQGPTPAQSVGQFFYGLRNLAGTPAGEKLLGALPRLVQLCSAQLSPQELSTAVYGLQHAPPGDSTAAVLAALANQAAKCTEPLTAQGVGNALYGLQRQGPAAGPLLRALTRLVSGCREPLRPLHVGCAFYGLQEQVGSAAADGMQRALAALIARSGQPLDAQGVAAALYGLRNTPHSPGAEQVLAALAPLIAACSEPLTGPQVGNALFGLQRQGNTPAAQKALAAIATLLPQCTDPLREQAVANAFHGLQGMAGAEALGGLLPRLTADFAALPEPVSTLALGQVLRAALALREAQDEPDAEDELLQAVIRRCPDRVDPGDENAVVVVQGLCLAEVPIWKLPAGAQELSTAQQRMSRPASGGEAALQEVLRRAGAGHRLQSNVWVMCFEMDIVIGNLNIEYDPPSFHDSVGQRRLSLLRARFLGRRGYRCCHIHKETLVEAVEELETRMERDAGLRQAAGQHGIDWAEARRLAAELRPSDFVPSAAPPSPAPPPSAASERRRGGGADRWLPPPPTPWH